MRPPRPWPSCRRARSRSMSSELSSSPAGMPSTIAVSPGPCDSPEVTKRKDMPPTPYLRGRGRRSSAARGRRVGVGEPGGRRGPVPRHLVRRVVAERRGGGAGRREGRVWRGGRGGGTPPGWSPRREGRGGGGGGTHPAAG